MQDFYPNPKIPRHPVPFLTPDDILRIGGEPYLPACRRLNGYELVHELHPERVLFLTHDDINERLDEESALIEYGGGKPEVKFLELLFHGRKLDEFPQKAQRIAKLREKLFLKYDEECLRNGHVNRSSSGFETWILSRWRKLLGPVRSDNDNGVAAPSVATFNRLYKEWLRYDRNILAILPRFTGPIHKTLTFSAESLNFAVLEARNFMSRLKPTKTQVYEGYCAAVHKENELRATEGKLLYHRIGKTKFYEIINSFAKFDVEVARNGLEAATKKFGPNLRSYDETLLGQRIEIDELNTDLMTVLATAGVLDSATDEQKKLLKKIRLWMCVIVDVATRYILAAHVTHTPNAQATLEALRMMMTDKTHISDVAGAKVPWFGRVKPSGSAYMDNGSEFLAERSLDALRALGVDPTRPEAGAPKKRPHIESLFHTIGPMFTQFFDGRTFRSIAEKGDYDPKAHAGLAAGEFCEILVRGIADLYNQKGHSALGGRSPHNALVDAIEGYGWMRPPQRVDLIRAFGSHHTATPGRYGIEKHGIPYNNEWLVDEQMDRGQVPFEIISDLGYLNSILVQAADGGWVEVENKLDLPPDLTEREWAEARKEEIAQNRRESQESYVAMRDFILKNRENGKAATLRAGLDPAVSSPAKLEKQRNTLYRNFIARPVSGEPIKPDTPVLPPPDELRGGTVARDRPTHLEPAPMPPPKTSKFERSKWDDEE